MRVQPAPRTSARIALLAGVLVVTTPAATGADAEPPSASGDAASPPSITGAASDMPALVADPDLPAVRFGYRGSLRGTLGVDIPVLRPERFHGFGLVFGPTIEFHGDPGDDELLPNDNWRGRARVEARWERRWAEGRVGEVQATLALEHESDHRTSPAPADPQARQLNFWSPGAGVLLRPGRGQLWLAAAPRIYFITCTRDGASCFGDPGNDSFGATLDAVYRVGRVDAPEPAFRFFAALHASAVAGNDEILPERRLILHAGTEARRIGGLYQIYGIVWLGHDVGYFRDRVDYQVGAAFAYSP